MPSQSLDQKTADAAYNCHRTVLSGLKRAPPVSNADDHITTLPPATAPASQGGPLALGFRNAGRIRSGHLPTRISRP